MARIMMLPLDERPCNYVFPSMMCEGSGDIALLMPPRTLLGRQKTPADCDGLRDWLLNNASGCDAAVLSVDMLVYGGIVPSRLHHMSFIECEKRLDVLRALRERAPKLKIYLFSLIMRAPAYDSSEEEPDYYADCGARINAFGQWRDKGSQRPLTEQESAERDALRVPPAALADFTARRAVNHAVNEWVVRGMGDGLADFLVVPLDDCAQYGWAAMEQRALRMQVLRAGLSGKVFLYSGADEVGSVLLARAVNEQRGCTPALFVRYSTVNGPLVIPKFEDRPLGENIKWQIAAAGGYTCDQPSDADAVLMVNAPTAGGDDMGEAPDRPEGLHPSYFTQRCLPEFVRSLGAYSGHKPVALADVALANGADAELMRLVQDAGLIGKLASYGAWNTAANTIGACIAHLMLGGGQPAFTLLRLVEDWLYMADVRGELCRYMDADMDVHVDGRREELAGMTRTLLQQRADAAGLKVRVNEVTFPWNRLFEIGLSLDESEAKNA